MPKLYLHITPLDQGHPDVCAQENRQTDQGVRRQP